MLAQSSPTRRQPLRRAALFQIEFLERRLLLSSAIAAFGAQQTFATGPNPRSVAIADVNSDGKPDLIVANSGASSVGVLLGNGNGTYLPQQTFSVGSGPFSVATADINRDGKLDLVVANSGSANISVLLGNGNGTFQPATNFSAGTTPRFVAIADVNGDGKPDAIVANYGSNTVSVLLGNGNGTFQGQQIFSTGTKPSSIAVADLNVDGKPDLAISNKGSNNVSILLGNGNGTFQTQQLFTVGSAPFSIAAGDLNQDGKLDLVAADESSNAVSVLLSNGNGTFQTQQTYATGSIPCAVALSDINGDGKLDVVAANYSTNNVSVLLGNGNGTLQPQKTFATGSNPFALVVADVSGDGRQDLLVANAESSTVGQLLGDVPPTVLTINRSWPPGPVTSDSTASFAVTISEPVTGVQSPDFSLSLNGVTANSAVNVSGSGTTYTATVRGISGNGTLGLNLLDNGDIKDTAGNPLQPGELAAFQPQQTLLVYGRTSSVAAADLNGDGKSDLVIDAKGTVSIFLGNGNGTFKARQSLNAGVSLQVVVADVNNDGIPDLVLAGGPTPFGGGTSPGVMLGNGNGTFQTEQFFKVGPNAYGLAVGDVNGDGKPDVVVTAGGVLSVVLGNGNGTFQPQKTFAAGTSPGLAVIADVNGDGKPDLIVTNSYHANDVAVLLGNGNGTFQTPRTFATGASPGGPVVADINGDGKPDIVTADFGDDTIGVLLGNGNGTFQNAQTFASGYEAGGMGVADFNGDGKPDLVVSNYNTGPGKYPGSVSVFLGNGNGTFRSSQTFAVGSEPEAVAISDLDGDGHADIIVGNYRSASVSVLFGSSTADFSGPFYTIVPNQDTINGTFSANQITLVENPDAQHIDWNLGNMTGEVAINDPNGLTINSISANSTIELDYTHGNPLPNIVHLNGFFTINGLSASNPLANTTLDIGRSTVYIRYSSSDPLSLVQSYLQAGYNNGGWNGTPAASSGVITSIPATQNAAQTTAIGYADSADGFIPGQLPNTIELKYTLYGDTTLTGTVGFNDFTRLTQHYSQTTGGTWDTGDFNYDGSVNFADFTLMTRTYNTSLGSQASPAATLAAASAQGATTSVTASSPTRTTKKPVIVVTARSTVTHHAITGGHHNKRRRR